MDAKGFITVQILEPDIKIDNPSIDSDDEDDLAEMDLNQQDEAK